MKKLALAMTLLVALASPAFAKHHHASKHHHARYARYDSGQIVAHPAGCPWHAFCGCGASVRVFGRVIPSLKLASNWYGFPRAHPAPGMAAVRNHHVFIIEAVNGDGSVMAYDANSGGHQTRIHNVSLAGYTVVNPHGSLAALRERHHARYAHHHHYRHLASGV